MIEKIESNQPPNFDEIRQRSLIQGVTGLMVPNAPLTHPIFLLTREKPTHFDPPGLTAAEVKEIASGKVYVIVFGQVWYEDIYKVPHWIGFCFWRAGSMGTFAARKCADYNQTDDN